MITLAVTVAALATRIQGQAVVDEKYAQAAALGYVADAKRVDVKKFPKFVACRGQPESGRRQPA